MEALENESHSLFNMALNWKMHIQWFIISQLFLSIFIRFLYSPDHIWYLFAITSIAIGFILYHLWLRVCLCDQNVEASKTAASTSKGILENY